MNMHQLDIKNQSATPQQLKYQTDRPQNQKKYITFQLKMYRQLPKYLPQMLTLNPQYQIFPSQSQIFANNFLVNNLVIRLRNTSITWAGQIDLSSLQQPLKDLIQFGQDFVEVYKNQNTKPKFGKQLNKKAIASFKPEKMINPRSIIRQSQKNGSKVLKIDLENNCFVVDLPHFSKYRYNQDDMPSPLDPKSRSQFNESDDDQFYDQRNSTNNAQSRISNARKIRPLFQNQSRPLKFRKFDEFNEQQMRQTEIEHSQQENSRQENILQILQQKNRRDAMEEQELQARRYEERQAQQYEQDNLRNRSSLNSSKRMTPTTGFVPGEKVHPVRKLETRKDYQQRISQQADKFNQDTLAFYQKTLISINPDMIQQLNLNKSQISRNSNRKYFQLDSVIAHQFIFSQQIGDSLRSILMLYMILYRFQEVQFDIQTKTQILKRAYTKDQGIQPLFESRKTTKIIKRQKLNTFNAHNRQEIEDFNRFIQNQKQECLVKYFQWLILKNQQHLDFPQNQPMKSLATYDVQAMYFRYMEYDSICKEMKEAKKKYPKQFLQKIKKQDKFQNALFVANIRQSSFRASQDFSPDLNYFFVQLNQFDADQSQEERMFKDYHWIIRVATQYFYSIKADLNPTIKNILAQYRQNFETLAGQNILCNQFTLLHHYFASQTINFEYFNQNQVSDKIFSWIFQQDHHIRLLLIQTQQNKTFQIEQSKALTQTICLKLLKEVRSQNKDNLFKYFRMVIQTIQKNTLIQELQDKVQIFNNLFYQKQNFAEALGQQFSKVINYWQHHSDTKETQFIKRISFEYIHNYFYRLQAKKINEPINRLYCYFNILDRYVDENTKSQIINLMMLDKKNSLVMHWSNKVLKRLLSALEFFLKTRQANLHLHIIQEVSRKNSKQNRMDIQEQGQVNRSIGSINEIKNTQENQYSQYEIHTIRNISLYLKIILKMEVINQENFERIYNLLIIDPKQNYEGSMFRLNDDHVIYMSKRILSMIFNEEPQHELFLKIAIRSKYIYQQESATLDYKLFGMLDYFSKFIKDSEFQQSYKHWSNQLRLVQMEEKAKNRY